MAKKIFDILPPEEPEKREEPVERKRIKTRTPFFKGEVKLKTTPIKKGLIFVIPLILIFIIFLGLEISRAEIKIWPVTETLTFETELTVDKEFENPDFENKTIPGQMFETEKTVSEEFLSSGKTPKKAEGVIRLYNAYTTKSENWLSGTRFVSAEGKLFKSKDRVFVPGAEIKDGKIVPKYVDVPVIAAESGEDYNIGPSHFSIYVFRGTPRYTKFYGESSEYMIGGGEAPQVTEKDLTTAQSLLIQEAETECGEKLRGEVSGDFVFLKDILETEILEKFSLARPGDEVEKFNFKVTTRCATLLFKKEDAENFVEQVIIPEIPEQKVLYRESLEIDYTPEIMDLELGNTTLSLDLSTEIYPEIDLLLLKKGLVGKSLSETKIFLENQPEFIRSEVQFWPFWVKSVPEDLEKIEITYVFID